MVLAWQHGCHHATQARLAYAKVKLRGSSSSLCPGVLTLPLSCPYVSTMQLGQDKCELPVPLVRSAHQHLVAAREEAARTAKELAELKASRVQHIPPSTWIKREQVCPAARQHS